MNSSAAAKIALACAIVTATAACQPEEPPNNLGRIDVVGRKPDRASQFVKPKSEEEIRKAYAEYVNNTDANDRFRVDALSRLAELELRASQKARQAQEGPAQQGGADDDRALEQLTNTIALLSASLEAFPTAKNNDILLYQLAKAHAEKGEAQHSTARLEQLTQQFPESQFYAEAQFRIGEDAFSRRKYGDAEHAYTEVIVSPGNDVFYEKALFKRGWSRFKQQFYAEAVDDLLDATSVHGFASYEKLNDSELEQYNEYFRAVGLAFSYLGGASEVSSYFKDKPEVSDLYPVYAALADVYFAQERYSDVVATYQSFIEQFPKADKVPYAHLKIIESWQQSGFDKQVYDAIERFYTAYNPASPYWKEQNENSNVNRVIRRSLKKYVVLMSGYYHNQYQKTRAKKDFEVAELWYTRYLEFYESYAQRDNIAFLYAELLSQAGEYERALPYYETAAYQNELIVDKEAAYASIYASDKLFASHPESYPEKNEYLDKLVTYVLRYVRAYPEDSRINEILVHAAELAFGSKEYKTAIELSDVLVANQKNDDIVVRLSDIKAQSYSGLEEFAEAERIYADLLGSPALSSAERTDLSEKLALAIYRQGEVANRAEDVRRAVQHYSRVSDVVPDTKIAATGLYDAAALEMQQQHWDRAIVLIQRFQQLYPSHERNLDVAKKLSVAYLNSNQGIKAAKEYEKLSSIETDASVKAAALWKAAEIYVDKGEAGEAIHAYESYATRFKKPFPQYMEAMYRLTELYGQEQSGPGKEKWLNRIVDADRDALNNVKTERTNLIASVAWLALANREREKFDAIRLALPLKDSLRRKKAAMENAVKLYGKASKYKIVDVVTEATYQIATIYKNFSVSLLESERPKELGEEELNQYEILLEDQAFPFEDKAIEFYEINLARTRDGHFNQWIRQSQDKLVGLFPERYKREPKQDVSVHGTN